MKSKTSSNGGSTDYYIIPPGATDLLDLIEHKNMSFGVGNIFKACYRIGEKDGIDAEYDLNKIIFFAQRALTKLKRAHDHPARQTQVLQVPLPPNAAESSI